MRVINPHVVPEPAQFAEDNKAAIDTWLAGQSEQRVDFDAVREAFPLIADRLTDGMLAEIFQRLGYAVED